MDKIKELVEYISKFDNSDGKAKLTELVETKFALQKDRKIFFCDYFVIRFSKSKNANFSNTVLALSKLKKYDDKPLIICLVTPLKNYLFLANSTFINKISHSSQKLSYTNLRGSFNGSDIIKNYDNKIKNSPENFEKLFDIHKEKNLKKT